jgi:hypothetical protein
MDATVSTAALSLEDGLRRGRPNNIRLRNLICARTVRLGELLGVAHTPRIRLLPGTEWDFPMWLNVSGQHSVLAQVGLSARLLQALGFASWLSLPVLSAVATQMLLPLLPSLRDLFEQDVRVHVENAAGRCPNTESWAKFMLWSSTLDLGVACRVHEAFSQRLVDRACAIPRKEHFQPRVPLFLGAQQLLTPSQLRGLQVGDVIVVEDAESHRLDLRIDAPAPLLTSPRLAVVNTHDGRIEHLSQGVWHELQRRCNRTGNATAVVDIVLAQMTLRAHECRELALGQCVVEWDRVAWLDEAELRACGRILGTARAVMVAGCLGYEVRRVSSGSRDW